MLLATVERVLNEDHRRAGFPECADVIGTRQSCSAPGTTATIVASEIVPVLPSPLPSAQKPPPLLPQKPASAVVEKPIPTVSFCSCSCISLRFKQIISSHGGKVSF